jgi:hypothetical protein
VNGFLLFNKEAFIEIFAGDDFGVDVEGVVPLISVFGFGELEKDGDDLIGLELYLHAFVADVFGLLEIGHFEFFLEVACVFDEQRVVGEFHEVAFVVDLVEVVLSY